MNAEHNIIRASVPVKSKYVISKIGLENSFLFLDDETLIEKPKGTTLSSITLSSEMPRVGSTELIDSYLLSRYHGAVGRID